MATADHGAEATQYLKKFIGEHYHYSEKPVFKALWDNYNECQFVEDTGEVPHALSVHAQGLRTVAPRDCPLLPQQEGTGNHQAGRAVSRGRRGCPGVVGEVIARCLEVERREENSPLIVPLVCM